MQKDFNFSPSGEQRTKVDVVVMKVRFAIQRRLIFFGEVTNPPTGGES